MPATSVDGGIRRFEELAAGQYVVVYQLETGIVANEGGTAISAATASQLPPRAVDAGGSIVVAMNTEPVSR